jgi:hypothetical protein
MSLAYKPDWEDVKLRYQNWWAGEAFDRCLLWVVAPKDGLAHTAPPLPPQEPVQRWTDLDYIAELNRYEMERTFYGAEAFPVWTGGYPGHTSIPAYLGCPTTLDDATGWWHPILREEDFEVRGLRIETEGRWWKFNLDLLRRAVRECPGRAIPSIGAFGGSGDTLAALRGSDQLLYDVVERPDRVRDAELHLMEMWIEVYQTFYDILQEIAQGSTCWFPLWSPGKFYAAQCDFSCMISTKMFEELFIPAVEMQTKFLDHCIFHVDGVDAFRHVPMLCELPWLLAIQVSPEAGKPDALHYMDTLKCVQAHRKNLWIHLAPSRIEEALANLSARGLCISTSCQTEAAARALIENVRKWSKDR